MVTEITRELVQRHGLTDEEYGKIKAIVGREPNITELGVFSVMWSEHCSYKNTRLELKKFPVMILDASLCGSRWAPPT